MCFKKKIFTGFFIFFIGMSYAQIELSQAKNDLLERNKKFNTTSKLYKEEKWKLDTLIKADSLIQAQEQLKKIDSLKQNLDLIYKESKLAYDFYLQSEMPKDSLNTYFNVDALDFKMGPKIVEPKKEEKVYLYFGDSKLIEKDTFFNKKEQNDVFKNILEKESKSHLGDFGIPELNKKIYTIKYDITKTRKEGRFAYAEKHLMFEKIDLELYEGSLVDIKVYLKDDQKNIYLFENKRPISILRYTRNAHMFYLEYSSKEREGIIYLNDSKYLESCYIRLADVLKYSNKPGKNFVPDNQNFSFPIKDENNSPTKYELHQDTSLKNVLELRAYTDFLGLFNDDSNGIAQFEGDASFFINPFRPYNQGYYLFKKVKPYVRYSRFDEGDNFLELNGTGDSLANRLNNIKKAYLDLGLRLDLLSTKFKKELPFEFNIYGAARYNVANITIEDVEGNYKTLGLGGGLNFDFRRFDNFSFNYSMEFMNYNQEDFNNYEQIIDSDKFWVFKNEAELSYYPADSKSRAIFLRLKVFSDMDKDIDLNFFQFQFGYKFNVGLNNVKNK